MRLPRRPLFLAPESYRRRRLMDGARMLPVAGAFLFLLPVLWRPASAGHDTAFEGMFLFAVWGGLILIAGLIAGPLFAAGEGEGNAADPPPEGQGEPDPAEGDGR